MYARKLPTLGPADGASHLGCVVASKSQPQATSHKATSLWRHKLLPTTQPSQSLPRHNGAAATAISRAPAPP